MSSLSEQDSPEETTQKARTIGERVNISFTRDLKFSLERITIQMMESMGLDIKNTKQFQRYLVESLRFTTVFLYLIKEKIPYKTDNDYLIYESPRSGKERKLPLPYPSLFSSQIDDQR